jgi:acetyl esterase
MTADSSTNAAPFVHPEARRQLDRIAASGEPPLETLSVADARRIADERVIRTNMAGEPVHEVRDVETDGPGGKLRLRIYTPAEQRNLPVLLFLHGGGWTVGNLDTHDPQCRRFANRAGCIVVAVDYRLAPEHRFPAAVEDIESAADWLARNAQAIGADPLRVAVAGDSSGGTLAASLAQMLRSRADIKLCLQILIYPGTDLRMTSPSYTRLGQGYFLTAPKMAWFIGNYVRTPADAEDPRASPLLAGDFANLPPALLLTAGLDPLLDEGVAYAERMRAAGGTVEHVNYEGWPHGFFFWSDSSAAADANARIEAALKMAFARP